MVKINLQVIADSMSLNIDENKLQISANPAFATNPTSQMIVGKLLIESGRISPMEWSETQNQICSPQWTVKHI